MFKSRQIRTHTSVNAENTMGKKEKKRKKAWVLVMIYVRCNVPKPPYDYERRRIEEGFRNFDHLGFLNVHPNLSTRAFSIFASIEDAAAAAGIRSRDLRASSRSSALATIDHCSGAKGKDVNQFGIAGMLPCRWEKYGVIIKEEWRNKSIGEPWHTRKITEQSGSLLPYMASLCRIYRTIRNFNNAMVA